jgi:simple sugar transport system permease protein
MLGGLLVWASGADPIAAYWQILVGALAWGNLPDTLNWAVPLLGMTLAAAMPLRGGMVNLGGDGQMVLGGLAAALVPLALPLPGPVAMAAAAVTAMLCGGAYAALAAWGEVRHGVPLLISTLLLAYPAIGVASYLVGFPLRDVASGLPQTVMIPPGARLPMLGGRVTAGLLAMLVVIALVVVFDRVAVAGFELRIRGLNPRFAAYGGIRLGRQTAWTLFASGAVAGLVGAIVVLGAQYRFTDGALVSPGYTWSGLMAALLAGGEPIRAVAAGLIFAALQAGGFAMQRATAVPRVLTMVLQALIILVLAARHGLVRRRE